MYGDHARRIRFNSVNLGMQKWSGLHRVINSIPSQTINSLKEYKLSSF